MKIRTWFSRVRFESKAARKVREEREQKEKTERGERCREAVDRILKEHSCQLAGTAIMENGTINILVKVVPLEKAERVTYQSGR